MWAEKKYPTCVPMGVPKKRAERVGMRTNIGAKENFFTESKTQRKKKILPRGGQFFV